MSPNNNLKGKWCLVTGASRGIGKAIAEAFAEEGGSLILVARSKDQLEQVAQSCKAKGAAEAERHSVDLSESASIDAFAQQVLQAHGSVDVLVNNAGKAPSSGNGPANGDFQDWESTIHLNLLAPMQLTRLFVPGMQKAKQGCIINIGSVAAVEPMKSAAVYAASKWGLRGWSLSCLEALREDNIKVMLINPAAVNTDMVAGRFIPERCLQPSDIAQAALLAVHTSPAANPAEVTVRLTLPAYKT